MHKAANGPTRVNSIGILKMNFSLNKSVHIIVRLSLYCPTGKSCGKAFSAQLQGHCRLSSHSAIPLVRANSQKTLSFFSRATCVLRVVVGRDGRLQACPALNFWRSSLAGIGFFVSASLLLTGVPQAQWWFIIL